MIRLAAPTLLLALAAAGCDAGVNNRTGLQAMLVATNARFVAGPLSTDMPPPVAGGPTVSISQFYSSAVAGEDARLLSGSVSQGGRSVAFGLADDVGYWVTPANQLDLDNPGSTSFLFSSTLSYSLATPVGAHTLVLRAVLADGSLGPPASQALMISDTDVVGALVITLAWDTEADLDLHVVAPALPDPSAAPGAPPGTIEVWYGNTTSLPMRSFAEGGPYSPDEVAAAGQLDFDSNASCVIDGRRQENVFWGAAPPPGHYVVRVDAMSMCGEVAARWHVGVFSNVTATSPGDPLITPASGQMGDIDTRYKHGPGAGLTVAEFDIPAPGS